MRNVVLGASFAFIAATSGAMAEEVITRAEASAVLPASEGTLSITVVTRSRAAARVTEVRNELISKIEDIGELHVELAYDSAQTNVDYGGVLNTLLTAGAPGMVMITVVGEPSRLEEVYRFASSDIEGDVSGSVAWRSQSTTYPRAVLEEALEQAFTDATDLAAAAGLDLGERLSIEDVTRSSTGGIRVGDFTTFMAGDTPDFENPTVSVTVRLRVTYDAN